MVELRHFCDTVQAGCPSACCYYYLKAAQPETSTLRYPPNGGTLTVRPIQLPRLPAGWYVAVYTRDKQGHLAERPLGSTGHELRVFFPGLDSTQATEAEFVASLPQGETEAEELAALSRAVAAKSYDGLAPYTEELLGANVEAKRRLLAVKVADQEKRHVRDSVELAEAAHLNDQYRLGLADAAQQQVRVMSQAMTITKQSLEMADHYQASIVRNAEVMKKTIEKFASPPPPPDYTPVLMGLTSAFRDLGVAGIQYLGGNRGAVAAQLKDSGSDSPVAGSTTAPKTADGTAPTTSDELPSSGTALIPVTTTAASSSSPSVEPPAPPKAAPVSPAQPTNASASSVSLPSATAAASSPPPLVRAQAEAVSSVQGVQREGLGLNQASGSPQTSRRSRPRRERRAKQQNGPCLYIGPLAGPHDPALLFVEDVTQGRAVTAVSRAPSGSCLFVTVATEEDGWAILEDWQQRKPQGTSVRIEWKRGTFLPKSASPIAVGGSARQQPAPAQPVASPAPPASSSSSPAASPTVAAPSVASAPSVGRGERVTPPRKEPGPSAHKPVSDSVAETLANAICGDLLGDPDSFTSFDEQRPIPPPTVAPVPSLAELERVTSNMDPETAHKLIASGAALEGLASLCFFNPMWKQILGKGR